MWRIDLSCDDKTDEDLNLISSRRLSEVVGLEYKPTGFFPIFANQRLLVRPEDAVILVFPVLVIFSTCGFVSVRYISKQRILRSQECSLMSLWSILVYLFFGRARQQIMS